MVVRMSRENIRNKVSTLRRTTTVQCADYLIRHGCYAPIEYDNAKQKQIEILYEGNESRWGECYRCKQKGDNVGRNEHYIKLVADKKPSLKGNHPLNMVFCCKNSQCNNENAKMKLVAENGRHKRYYDYIIEHCPDFLTNESQEKLMNLFIRYKQQCIEWYDEAEIIMQEQVRKQNKWKLKSS